VDGVSGTPTLTVGDKQRGLNVQRRDQEHRRHAGLTKVDNGTLKLTGTNNLLRATMISGGTLELGTSGSISNSTAVSVTAAARCI